MLASKSTQIKAAYDAAPVLRQMIALKPRLHVPFKALRKPVYVKPISCKRTKAVSKPIWLNHIRRWFETGLKRFGRACKQLKRFEPLYLFHF